ncbi:DUF4430 domain-containing protein [Marinisporobacter balticus]|uniref:Uncharacterized protein DUF4430 n=1 Tax=Marinisporobacter balticus TaxID=2018667 RepID=A0A4R2KLC1_9FIRM|nr:DUF4430 domain-containing protein [Marinisporobacter balticus]TCO71476.1 uncharacterized protein DUF4430 [Marinisporobacter balticus]
MKKGLFIFLCIIFICTCVGCTEKSTLENGKIEVIVSRDFGNEIVSEKAVDFSEDSNAIEVMEENFDIETAYGGGFINAIGGLKSGFTGVEDKKKVDWFYYVNGILPEVGAQDYYLKSGDVVVWDYHDWSNNRYGSSIIGAYPINFINAHDENVLKTEITYEKNYEKESQGFASFLKEQGVKNIVFKNMDEQVLENGEINSILIGSWDALSKSDTIKGFYENGKKTGLYFKMDKNIKALNEKGEIAKEYKKGAVITSIVKEYGLSGTIWLITGNDEACIKKAIKLLYENPEKLKGKFSIIVTEDEMVNIPIKN